MLKTVEGIYQGGQVLLGETPSDVEGARVLVTFLPQAGDVDVREHGVSQEQAADLRWRLSSAAEDWERPEMAVYDDL